ncbi:TrmH family RNA methyltransferase [Patescibacteria group bacterium]|nr:TrmH family RNA methyltransferase [Patescibacteria group bacterium]
MKGSTKTSAVRGIQGKCDEPYSSYDEEHFAQDNEEMCRLQRSGMKAVILCDVRSSYNVGASFRTCEGAGVDMLYLAGYTPHPIDRFGREVAEIKKTSLGASTMVPWTAADDIEALILKLQSQGVTVVAVEQTPHSISLYDFTVPDNVVYIFGNEITGVLPEVVELCDHAIEIPMAGRKESLNVSVTVGIVLFQK